MLNARGLDVVGTQEFQERQFDYFVAKGYTKHVGRLLLGPRGQEARHRER